MFRPSVRSLLVNKPSAGQKRQYATTREDEMAMRTWYRQFRPEDITRDRAKIDRTKSKVTIRYPLDGLPKGIPRIILDKVYTSIYAKNTKNGKGYLEVDSEIDGSIEKKENYAWNTIAMIIHNAALSKIEGNFVSKQNFSQQTWKLKKEEFEAFQKREKEFRAQQFKDADDVVKSTKLEKAAKSAHARTVIRDQSLNNPRVKRHKPN